MSAHNSLVATYAKPRLAEADIRKLQQAGFDMQHLSVVGHHPMGSIPVADGFDSLDNTVCECIPPDLLRDYTAEMDAGRTVLIAHGDADEITHAQRIIAGNNPENWDSSADYTLYYGCGD